MTTRQDLHRLVDELPDEELDTVRHYLERVRDSDDPILGALLDASEDDEPASEEEDREADEAWAEYKRGEARPWTQVRDELE